MAEPALLLPLTLVFEPMSAEVRFRRRFVNRKSWVTVHSGAEGILGEVVSPIQVSYLSKSVSTSRFRICRSLNISLGSE